jgi:hypothetical protein
MFYAAMKQNVAAFASTAISPQFLLNPLAVMVIACRQKFARCGDKQAAERWAMWHSKVGILRRTVDER